MNQMKNSQLWTFSTWELGWGMTRFQMSVVADDQQEAKRKMAFHVTKWWIARGLEQDHLVLNSPYSRVEFSDVSEYDLLIDCLYKSCLKYQKIPNAVIFVAHDG